MIGKSSEEEIRDFILANCSCALPSNTSSPQLYHVVSNVQAHRCGFSCSRRRKVSSGQYIKVCRSGFPRRVTESFQLNSVQEALKSRKRTTGKITRLYDLPRRECERNINDYNPLLLLLHGQNMVRDKDHYHYLVFF